jgi:hypothetical protein
MTAAVPATPAILGALSYDKRQRICTAAQGTNVTMGPSRWPWLLVAGLMLACAAAWSTYLHWLPCRVAMLSGNIIYGYAYHVVFPGL